MIELRKLRVTDWILIVIALIALLANFLLYFIKPELINSLSSILFQIITLIFTVLISYRIAVISEKEKTIELQKNTAKTAVRHIRGYQQNVIALMQIVNNKMSRIKKNNMKDNYEEIYHHLINLSIGIGLSENDFKDIIGEELKEENTILIKLLDDIELLKQKNDEADNNRKLKEKISKEKTEALNEEIRKLREEISKSFNKLPIGSSINIQTPSLAPTKNIGLLSNLQDSLRVTNASIAKAILAQMPHLVLELTERKKEPTKVEDDK